MAKLNKEELTKVLNVIFGQLQQNGMLPANVANKEALVERVVKQLDEGNIEIDKDNLHEASLKKALSLALVSEFAAEKHPDLKFDYKILFQDVSDTPKEEVKKDIKNELQKIFLALLKLTPGAKLSQKELDERAEKMANKALKKFGEENANEASLANNNHTMDALTLALLNLYGGIDPRGSNGIKIPTFTFTGNAGGIADMDTSRNATSTAPIDELNRPDGKEDYLGLENRLFKLFEALSNTIEEELEEQGVYVSAPRPHMPGYDIH